MMENNPKRKLHSTPPSHRIVHTVSKNAEGNIRQKRGKVKAATRSKTQDAHRQCRYRMLEAVGDERLCGTGRGDRLGDLRDLVAGPDDALALVVFDELNVLVFPLSALPDLDLTAATDDAYSHGGEQVVSGVGVHVYAAVEHGGGILADAGLDHGLPTWVFLDEIGDVVNNAGHSDQTSPILGLILEVLPIHDGQRIERDTPIELGALLVERLLHLLNSALLDLVRFELLEIICETELLPDPN